MPNTKEEETTTIIKTVKTNETNAISATIRTTPITTTTTTKQKYNTKTWYGNYGCIDHFIVDILRVFIIKYFILLVFLYIHSMHTGNNL
jgi:uncharacterized membrane protein